MGGVIIKKINKKSIVLSIVLTIVFVVANSLMPAIQNITYNTYSTYSNIVYAAPKGGFKSGSFGKSSSSFSKSFKSGSFSTSKSSKTNNSSTAKSSIFGKPSSSGSSYNTKRSFIPIPFPVFTSHRSYLGGGFLGFGIISAFVKFIIFIIIIIFIIRLIRKIKR